MDRSRNSASVCRAPLSCARNERRFFLNASPGMPLPSPHPLDNHLDRWKGFVCFVSEGLEPIATKCTPGIRPGQQLREFCLAAIFIALQLSAIASRPDVARYLSERY